jgi:DNA ligase-1
MQFSELAAAYERLEATKKRLEMRAILVDLFRPLRPPDLDRVLYLSQGMLRPEYEGVELGVADSLARKAVATATHTPEAELARKTKVAGDLGTVVGQLVEEHPRLEAGEPLTVAQVYTELERIARASGAGSQETKVRILTELIARATPVEAKFLVRFVMGTLRVGVREMTILDALAVVFADDSKAARTRVEAAFNLSSDLGLVAGALLDGGLDGLARINLEVGRPVRPMLAERELSLKEVLGRMEGRTALEYKYDGLRMQAHVATDGTVRLFSRRLEETSAQFPELVRELPKAVHGLPAIIEGECVPIDPETDEIQPFQAVSRRRGRKHDLAGAQEEIPVCLFLFDVLLAGGTPVWEQDLPARRAILASILTPTERVRLATQKVVSTEDEATAFLGEAIAAGGEGVMAKSVAAGSSYRAGARGYWWIKYKRDYTVGLTDSIDGVVVGAFSGRGRRAGRYGAFLLAIYDRARDRYESFCKVGSGFDDAALAEMPGRLDRFRVPEKPAEVDTTLAPDQWFRPSVVLEVRGAELTLSPVHPAAQGTIKAGLGFALRFPRYTGRVREEKGPTDATTSLELLHMYRAQVRQAEATPAEERTPAEG